MLSAEGLLYLGLDGRAPAAIDDCPAGCTGCAVPVCRRTLIDVPLPPMTLTHVANQFGVPSVWVGQ